MTGGTRGETHTAKAYDTSSSPERLRNENGANWIALQSQIQDAQQDFVQQIGCSRPGARTAAVQSLIRPCVRLNPEHPLTAMDGMLVLNGSASGIVILRWFRHPVAYKWVHRYSFRIRSPCS